MKINGIVAFLSMLLVVTYLLVSRMDLDTFGDMARFTPDNALLYIEQKDLLSAVATFEKSPLWEKITEIDFVNISDKDIAFKAIGSTVIKIEEAFATLLNDKLADKLFGERVALCLLQPKKSAWPTLSGGDSEQNEQLEQLLLENSIIITQPKHSAKLLEIIAESYAEYSSELSITTAQYGNHHIKRIKKSKDSISVVAIDGLFIMSINEKQLRNCIDAFDGDIESLVNNKTFMKAKREHANPERFFYLSIGKLRNFVEDIAEGEDFIGKDLFLEKLETTIGFDAISVGSYVNKNAVKEKIVVSYNKNDVNTIVQDHLNSAPTSSQMLGFTSETPIIYYWSNVFNFKHFIPYLTDAQESDPKANATLDLVEKESGYTIDELVSFLGQEVSIVVEQGSEKSYINVPLGITFIRVDKVDELKNGLDKLIKNLQFPMIDASQGETVFRYWALSLQDGIEPLYGFYKDYLFISNSINLTKNVLKFQDSGKTLLQLAKVKELNPGLEKPNNSITYFNNIEVIKLTQKGLGLIGTIIAIEDRDAAKRGRLFIESLINPVLDGLTMYDRSCTRSYFTDDMVIVESMTSIVH